MCTHLTTAQLLVENPAVPLRGLKERVPNYLPHSDEGKEPSTFTRLVLYITWTKLIKRDCFIVAVYLQ